MALIQDGEKYKIISTVNHCVLDILGGHPVNSTHLITYKWIEGAHQIWEAHEISEGTFLLASTAHGDKAGKLFAMDASGTDHGHPIVYAAHGKGNQQWVIEPVKSNGFLVYIKNKQSNKVLQSHGERAEVTLVAKDVKNPNQWWGLLELDAHPLPGRINPETENKPVNNSTIEKVEKTEDSSLPPPPPKNADASEKIKEAEDSKQNGEVGTVNVGNGTTNGSLEKPVKDESSQPQTIKNDSQDDHNHDHDSDKSGAEEAASKPKPTKKPKKKPEISFQWEEV